MPRRKGDEEFEALWERFRKRIATVPYRTAFVVQVPTIYGAVEDTFDAFDGRRDEGEGIRLSKELGGTHVWAVVFLGNLHSGDEVVVKSVLFTANEVTVTVAVERSDGDIVGQCVPHLYWVPLPEVRPGPLTLRLHDRGTGTDLILIRTDLLK